MNRSIRYLLLGCLVLVQSGCPTSCSRTKPTVAQVQQSAKTLGESSQSQAARIEAADLLGNTGNSLALQSLQAAVDTPLPLDTKLAVVRNLGKFPFKHTEARFSRWILAGNPSNEFAATAAEALANSDRDAMPLLLETATTHRSPETRAAAAWSLGQNAGTGHIGVRLAELTAVERDPLVRRRLFEALAQQSDVPVTDLMDQAIQETDTAARIAAFNAVAVGLRKTPGLSTGGDRFTQLAIPELKNIALHHDNLNLRMRSVFALIRSGLPAAARALEHIASAADEPISGTAARGVVRLSYPQAQRVR